MSNARWSPVAEYWFKNSAPMAPLGILPEPSPQIRNVVAKSCSPGRDMQMRVRTVAAAPLGRG